MLITEPNPPLLLPPMIPPLILDYVNNDLMLREWHECAIRRT